ncbi:MAG: MCP four helix bundle domain-containing protein [Chitinivibrionales bacterium]|nr:MCP four helix bundle domain-containing protein [Chitinivibrionales bacterium]
MLNRIKLGPKLIGGFLIVALIAGGIGIFGVSSMKTIDAADTKLFEKMTKPLGDLIMVVASFHQIRINLRDMIRANDPTTIEQKWARVNELDAVMQKNLENFQKTIMTDEVRKLYDEFIAYDKKFAEGQNRLYALSKENKDVEAWTLVDGDLNVTAKAEQAVLEKIEDIKIKQADDTANENTATANQATTIMLITIAIGVLFACILGISLTISITRPLTKGVTMMQELAKGHLNNRLNIKSDDEIGLLSNAMDLFADDMQKIVIGTMQKIAEGDVSTEVVMKDNQDEIGPALKKMIDALRGLIAETGRLRASSVDGKLDVRGDALKFKGAYKDIVNGINETLDAVIKPLNVSAEYIDRISKGDIPALITDKYNGDFNEIKNNLNRCINAVNLLVTDTNALSKAAVEGKLDVRADASKHEGDYRKVVQGVNDTLDSVIKPLNVSAEYIDRISKGDIPPFITDNYNGDFNEIKNNLNKCITALNGLIHEMNNMSKQHDAGEIDVAIPVEKFDGAYREMATGVNTMVMGHIAVKKKAMACIAEFGKGNFEAPLEKFPGKKAFINDNIERLRTNIKDFISQMKHMSDEHNAGDIDVVIPADKFDGSYRTMASGVNEMVMGHIAVKKKAMACIAEFGKGNFDAPLEKFPGKKVFINETIEGVRKNLKDIATEIYGLIEASKNGNLTRRGNSQGYFGDWQKLVGGINDILDAILQPINEAAGVLERMANRDLTSRVQGEYKGDHAKIKMALNTALNNLDQTLRQVSEATEQVSSASQQISAGSQTLSQGASEQASSLEEVSSSLEEMASMTKQNAENANQAKSLAGEANGNAAEGTDAMKNMTVSINKIKESSDQTAKIVKTIDEIAMQTNLLALNAAVEAARAGEAGRGFAVVAEEVRNLAQRSAQAAKNTADMIAESVKNADGGVKIALDVNKSFESIVSSVKKVNDLIAEIAAASQEQSQGIDQVNTAVAQMDKVTQQNAANAEESASSSEELSSQAQELASMIAQFQITSTYDGPGAKVALTSATTPAVSKVSHHTKSYKGNERRKSSSLHLKHSEGNSATMTASAAKEVTPEDIIPLGDEDLKDF